MVQDFTHVGTQPEKEAESALLAQAVRTGFHPGLDPSRPAYEVARHDVEIPFGIDAPSKGLRQLTSGGWALMTLVKYGMGSLVFLVAGALASYVTIMQGFELGIFCMAAAGLAMSVFLARRALHAARNLLIIARA